MAYTNNGDYRMQDVVITKTIGGSPVAGYPTTYRITAASDNAATFTYLGNPVTETYLRQLPEGSAVTSGTYLNLLATFRAWVEAYESGLDTAAVETNNAYGTNATWCLIA